MAVKLWPTLPKDHEANGLTALERPLMDEPDGPYYVVCEVDRKRFTFDDDAEENIPTIRVLHGEALFGDDARVADQLLRKAQEQRCGPRPKPAPEPAAMFDGNGSDLAEPPGDENPEPEDDPGTSGEPDASVEDPGGDLEPAAGSPPFLAPVPDDE